MEVASPPTKDAQEAETAADKVRLMTGKVIDRRILEERVKLVADFNKKREDDRLRENSSIFADDVYGTRPNEMSAEQLVAMQRAIQQARDVSAKILLPPQINLLSDSVAYRSLAYPYLNEYNMWVTQRLSHQLSFTVITDLKPESMNIKLKFEDVRVCLPVTEDGEVATPSLEAIRQRSYMANIYCTVRMIRKISGKVMTFHEQILVGQLPVMINSCLCRLNVVNFNNRRHRPTRKYRLEQLADAAISLTHPIPHEEEERAYQDIREEYGEIVDKHVGSFLIDGRFYIGIASDVPRQDQIMVYHDKKGDLIAELKTLENYVNYIVQVRYSRNPQYYTRGTSRPPPARTAGERRNIEDFERKREAHSRVLTIRLASLDHYNPITGKMDPLAQRPGRMKKGFGFPEVNVFGLFLLDKPGNVKEELEKAQTTIMDFLQDENDQVKTDAVAGVLAASFLDITAHITGQGGGEFKRKQWLHNFLRTNDSTQTDFDSQLRRFKYTFLPHMDWLYRHVPGGRIEDIVWERKLGFVAAMIASHIAVQLGRAEPTRKHSWSFKRVRTVGAHMEYMLGKFMNQRRVQMLQELGHPLSKQVSRGRVAEGEPAAAFSDIPDLTTEEIDILADQEEEAEEEELPSEAEDDYSGEADVERPAKRRRVAEAPLPRDFRLSSEWQQNIAILKFAYERIYGFTRMYVKSFHTSVWGVAGVVKLGEQLSEQLPRPWMEQISLARGVRKMVNVHSRDINTRLQDPSSLDLICLLGATTSSPGLLENLAVTASVTTDPSDTSLHASLSTICYLDQGIAVHINQKLLGYTSPDELAPILIAYSHRIADGEVFEVWPNPIHVAIPNVAVQDWVDAENRAHRRPAYLGQLQQDSVRVTVAGTLSRNISLVRYYDVIGQLMDDGLLSEPKVDNASVGFTTQEFQLHKWLANICIGERRHGYLPLFHNGAFVGYTHPESQDFLRQFKRTGYFSRTLSLAHTDGPITQLQCTTQAGRLVAPLFVRRQTEEQQKSIADAIAAGTPMGFAAHIANGTIEFIDSLEREFTTITYSQEQLDENLRDYDREKLALDAQIAALATEGVGQRVDVLARLNIARRKKRDMELYGTVEYESLDPSTQLGSTASMGPFITTNTGVRGIFVTQQNRSAITQATGNRVSYGNDRALLYGNEPLYSTRLSDMLDADQRSFTSNVLTLINSGFKGMTQEDASVLATQAVEAGLYAHSLVSHLVINTVGEDRRASMRMGLRPGADPREIPEHIGPEGVVLVNTVLTSEKQVIALRYTPATASAPARQSNVLYGKTVPMIVHSVQRTETQVPTKLPTVQAYLNALERDENDLDLIMTYRVVKENLPQPEEETVVQYVVTVKRYSSGQAGDKFSPMQGQKTVGAVLVPPEKMPVVIGKPDMIIQQVINQVPVVGRSTVATMYESVMTRATDVTPMRLEATPFSSFNPYNFHRAFIQNGMTMGGMERIADVVDASERLPTDTVDPETGRILRERPERAFVGRIAYMLLDHLVLNKQNPQGNLSLRPEVASEGIRRGQRFAHMEVAQLMNHGGAQQLRERLSSDVRDRAVCRECGRVSTLTTSGACRFCNSHSFLRVEMPEILETITHIMATAGNANIGFGLTEIP